MKINRNYCNKLPSEEKINNIEVICTVTSKENEATFYAVGLSHNNCLTLVLKYMHLHFALALFSFSPSRNHNH